MDMCMNYGCVYELWIYSVVGDQAVCLGVTLPEDNNGNKRRRDKVIKESKICGGGDVLHLVRCSILGKIMK